MNDERKTLWGGHLIQNTAQQNVQFCAGRDVREVPMADEILLPFDIWTNRAHCIMLEQCGLIQGMHLLLMVMLLHLALGLRLALRLASPHLSRLRSRLRCRLECQRPPLTRLGWVAP